MVKSIRAIAVLSLMVWAEEIPERDSPLYQNCISCHVQEQIPSELIYRRYLMQYGSKEAMHHAITRYLKTPDPNNSIMPKQFFMKSPQKEPTDLNNTALEESIDAYLEFYDVVKRLIVP